MNEIVKQNILLRKELDSFILQVKSLKENCAGLEELRLNAQNVSKMESDPPRDGYRWVEGSSDTESCGSVEDGEKVGNRSGIVRNNNK